MVPGPEGMFVATVLLLLCKLFLFPAWSWWAVFGPAVLFLSAALFGMLVAAIALQTSAQFTKSLLMKAQEDVSEKAP